jgi:hypothetical protein
MATVLRSIGALSMLALLLVFASVAPMEAVAAPEETTKMEEMAAPVNLARRTLTGTLPPPSNNYTRGCSPITRCRGGPGAAN